MPAASSGLTRFRLWSWYLAGGRAGDMAAPSGRSRRRGRSRVGRGGQGWSWGVRGSRDRVEEVVEGVRQVTPGGRSGRVLGLGEQAGVEQGEQAVAVEAGGGEGEVLAAVAVLGVPVEGGGGAA